MWLQSLPAGEECGLLSESNCITNALDTVLTMCLCGCVAVKKLCVCVAKDSLPAQYPILSQDHVSGFYIFREFTACSFLPNLANVSLTLAGRRLRSSRQVCCCVTIWTSVCSSMWASKPSLSLSGSRLSLCLLSITPFRIQSV